MLHNIRLLLSSLMAANIILEKSEKTAIFFRFIVIWRKYTNWGSLLAPSAVSILRSEVLSYNKRNYFNCVQHPTIVGIGTIVGQKPRSSLTQVKQAFLWLYVTEGKTSDLCMNLPVLSSVPLLLPKITFLNLSLVMPNEIRSGSRWSWRWCFILRSDLHAFSFGPCQLFVLLIEGKEFFWEERQFCLTICTMSIFLILSWKQSGFKSNQKCLDHNGGLADWFAAWLLNAWVLTICFFLPSLLLRQGRTSVLPLLISLLSLLPIYIAIKCKRSRNGNHVHVNECGKCKGTL